MCGCEFRQPTIEEASLPEEQLHRLAAPTVKHKSSNSPRALTRRQQTSSFPCRGCILLAALQKELWQLSFAPTLHDVSHCKGDKDDDVTQPLYLGWHQGRFVQRRASVGAAQTGNNVIRTWATY